MATIKTGGGGTDEWTIDPISKAGRTTIYDVVGNAVGTSLAGLNRALNTAGFLRDSQFGYNANVGAFGDQLVSEKIFLAGKLATNPLDGTQWTTPGLSGSGAVSTASGAFVLTTGATANSAATLRSVPTLPLTAGTNNVWYCALQLSDTGTINNEKRWGIGNATDGIDFSLQGSTASFVTRVNGVETRSNLWSTQAPTIDLNPHVYSITWAQGGYTLLQDGNLLTQVFTGAVFTNPNLFQMAVSNTNTAGSTTPITLTCVGMAAFRLGSSDGTTTITNFPATQAISAAALPLPTNAATETGGNLAGLNSKITTTANGVKVDGSAVTQPVTGTVAVSALPAVSGTVAVSNFPATQSVSGTVAVTQSGSWTATVTQAAGTNLHTTVDNFPASQPVTGTFFQTTQPVSIAATVAVSAAALPLPTGAATDANLTSRTPLGANGALQVTSLDGAVQTYAAGIASLTLAAAATDVFTINGSATKTIKITRICLSFIATTAISVPVSLIKRSTANTGGTSATQAGAPFDSTNAAATATCRSYTANPTALGAAVGTVLAAGKIAAPLTGGVEPLTVLDFGIGSRQAVTLRGAAEGLAINLNGATVAGGSAAVSIEWTES